jgi:O-antigen ligase
LIENLRRTRVPSKVWTLLLVAIVLGASMYLGRQASVRWLVLLLAGISAIVVLVRPTVGLLALVPAALLLPLEIGTGTDVTLNLVTLLVPALVAIWLLNMVRQRQFRLASSSVNLPLALFLGASLLSLLIGRATWDPLVPVGANFLVVQLAQWAIFAFSAAAFWLAANLLTREKDLRRLTAAFLLVGGGVAMMRVLPGVEEAVEPIATLASTRAPFWTLLTALAVGQLLFNQELSRSWRIFLIVVVGVSVYYAFVTQRDVASVWVGVATVMGTLLWLRLRHLRWVLALVIFLLIAVGVLFPTVYNFAGGDAEWDASGGSRLALTQRVVEVTMRNPVTGLGPAAYRPYANLKPLPYGHAYWIAPQINSHNNYVDLFAHGGILGLVLFLWFVWEVTRLALALRRRVSRDFAAGYVNGMLAAGMGALAIMVLADWILPFVYNIGFAGFQASVLVWLFLGGLVALRNMQAEGEQRQ